MSWNILNKSYPDVLRSTNQQTTAALLWQPPGITAQSVSSTGVTTSFISREGIAIRRFELHNRSGGVASVGIGFRLQNRFWVAGQWDDSEAVAYLDDTTDAQDAGASDFALESLVNNDGFVIASPVPFAWVSINVGTAGVDGAASTDRLVRYSNAAGTGWTALGANATYTDIFTSVNTVYAAGANEFVWQPPADWGQVVSLNSIPPGMYALNIRSTDAPDTTAALATTIEVGTMLVVEAVADNGIYENELTTYSEAKADGLVAYFSTANAGNRVYCEVTSA